MKHKHTKQSAGQLGGLATLSRYGPDHMRAICDHEPRDKQGDCFYFGEAWQMKKIFLILLILPALACSLMNSEITRAKLSPLDAKPAAQIKTPSPTATACQVKTGVDAGLLNLRSGPGTSFESLTILHEGEAITLLDKPAPEGNGWLYVETHSLQGWVNPNFINRAKEILALAEQGAKDEDEIAAQYGGMEVLNEILGQLRGEAITVQTVATSPQQSAAQLAPINTISPAVNIHSLVTNESEDAELQPVPLSVGFSGNGHK